MSDKDSIGSYASIEEDLKALQAHIGEYRKVVNEEAVWLFLTTLACWSAPTNLLKLAGFGIAVFLFGTRITDRVPERRTIPELAKAVQQRILDVRPDDNSREAPLSALQDLKSNAVDLHPIVSHFS